MSKPNFDFNHLAPQSQSVLWKGKTYILREPTEGAWAEYEGVLDQARRYDENGKFVGLNEGWRRADAVLVAGCLFEVRDGGHEFAVPLDEVKRWPHRLIDPLVEWCKEAGQPPKDDQLPKSSAAGPASSASPTS